MCCFPATHAQVAYKFSEAAVSLGKKINKERITSIGYAHLLKYSWHYSIVERISGALWKHLKAINLWIIQFSTANRIFQSLGKLYSYQHRSLTPHSYFIPGLPELLLGFGKTFISSAFHQVPDAPMPLQYKHGHVVQQDDVQLSQPLT